MSEADVVLLIGRKLDYQLGYGSPAVFPNARFIRIADNRPASSSTIGAASRNCSLHPILRFAMVKAAGNRETNIDRSGRTECGAPPRRACGR